MSNRVLHREDNKEESVREYEVLSEEDLRVKRGKYHKLRTLARPYVDNISYSFLGNPYVIILADKEGYVLDIKGENGLLQELGLVEGTCLNEECIGAVLKQKEPVLIYGDEHESYSYNDLVCYGVPINDRNGEILGVMVLSQPIKRIIPDKYSLVLLSVASIETALKQVVVDEDDDELKNISEIVATAVHDLKNPLSIIQALAKLGSNKAESTQTREYFMRIRKQTKQLTNLLNSVIVFSNPERFTSVLPAKVVENIIDDIRPLAETNNIDILVNNTNKVKVNLKIKIFTRALHNILINSIDCMKGNGSINVSICDTEDNVLIIIEDNGPGIPKEIQGSLFQPFVSKREGGTGLGLYMVYQTITKVHKGEIWFESEKEEGTRFYITIPYPEYCII